MRACRRLPGRQSHTQNHHQQRHRHGRGEEYRPPAKTGGNQTGHRPCQQYANQQPAHHIADDTATQMVWRQIGSQRHKHLHGNGGEPHQSSGHQKHPASVCRCNNQQSRNRRPNRQHQQPARLHNIAQWHQQQQPRRVAQLHQRHHQARRMPPEPDIWPDQRNKRLRIVNIRDNNPAGRRQQKHHRRGRCSDTRHAIFANTSELHDNYAFGGSASPIAPNPSQQPCSPHPRLARLRGCLRSPIRSRHPRFPPSSSRKRGSPAPKAMGVTDSRFRGNDGVISPERLLIQPLSPQAVTSQEVPSQTRQIQKPGQQRS